MAMKILCLYFSICIITIANAQNKNFGSIEGDISGLNNQNVYLIRVNANGGIADTIATMQSINGRFSFDNVSIKGAEFFFLKLDSNISKQYKTIFLDGSQMLIKGEIEDWPNSIKIVGSKAHQDYESFREVDTFLTNQIQRASLELSKLKRKRNLAIQEGRLVDTLLIDNEMKAAKGLLEEKIRVRNEYWRNFIDSRSDSYYLPFLIIRFQSQLGLNGLKNEYARLTHENRKSFWGMQLKNEVDNNIKHDRIKIGGIVPDFISTSPNGDKLSLYEIIKTGKYTLIDFWASWCGPCIDEFSNVREVYKKYHSQGLNIVGISNDIGGEAWKRAIINHELNWYNVSDLDGNQGVLSKSFGIYKLPTNFLVDFNGKIVAIDIFKDDLWKALGKYLGGLN